MERLKGRKGRSRRALTGIISKFECENIFSGENEEDRVLCPVWGKGQADEHGQIGEGKQGQTIFSVYTCR